ncbi:MAG: hypothetical protein ACI8RZ_005379 [Myxococcota bacterium]
MRWPVATSGSGWIACTAPSWSAELTGAQHIEGAHAAQDLGDIQDCYDRLRAAVRLEPSKELIDWLWAIDTQSGQVESRYVIQAAFFPSVPGPKPHWWGLCPGATGR